MMDIRAVRDRSELREVFELLGSQFPGPITADYRAFHDLALRFPLDQPLMVVATADGSAVGGALAFREENDWVGLRILAVTEHFRHRGIGRRLVERVEAEASRLGTDGVALGTDDAIGFFHHLGYTPNLLFQWVYDPERFAEESEAVLGGPLAGLHHWRSSFNGVPQLFVELDAPRLDLRHRLRERLIGCHVGFMLSKRLTAATAGRR